ncbi:type II toxin-antitoxin system PemK/MazF family toxin [Paraclostridium bifermentans]|uniref:type II toxin-antitoxin system PemK/MazF family toxin n=1 Tax=Paraclostridium bifermentans TaxID=1490 RepID=UPI00241DD3EB|nr:type II toxin-antitoxin system PemK/MazF family toxin [Paraclostridium bifermentans]
MAWNKEKNIRDASCWLADKVKLIELKEYQKNNNIQTNIFRGGIFNVDLGSGNIGGEKNKIRPCIVLSRTTLNVGDTVVVVPLTTKFPFNMTNGKKTPKYKNHYVVHKSKYTFLKDDSCIKFEDIRSIDKVRIKNLIGNLDNSDLKSLEKRLTFTMGF